VFGNRYGELRVVSSGLISQPYDLQWSGVAGANVSPAYLLGRAEIVAGSLTSMALCTLEDWLKVLGPVRPFNVGNVDYQ
jgi:hypothetical protein